MYLHLPVLRTPSGIGPAIRPGPAASVGVFCDTDRLRRSQTMITRDYVMRQVQHIVQALAQVMFKKRDQAHDEATALIEETITDVTGLTASRIRKLDRDRLLTLCSRDGALHGDLAMALADLLREDGHPRSLVRARWLYEAAITSGRPVPFDIKDRIAALPDSDPTW